MKFYGIAVNTLNKHVVINNLPTDCFAAVKEAKRIATKEGLKFQFVKPAVNGQKRRGYTHEICSATQES